MSASSPAFTNSSQWLLNAASACEHAQQWHAPHSLNHGRPACQAPATRLGPSQAATVLNARPLPQGDAYPESVQLAKGEYTLRLWLRHESREVLDKLKATCAVMVGGERSGGARAGWAAVGTN